MYSHLSATPPGPLDVTCQPAGHVFSPLTSPAMPGMPHPPLDPSEEASTGASRRPAEDSSCNDDPGPTRSERRSRTDPRSVAALLGTSLAAGQRDPHPARCGQVLCVVLALLVPVALSIAISPAGALLSAGPHHGGSAALPSSPHASLCCAIAMSILLATAPSPPLRTCGAICAPALGALAATLSFPTLSRALLLPILPLLLLALSLFLRPGAPPPRAPTNHGGAPAPTSPHPHPHSRRALSSPSPSRQYLGRTPAPRLSSLSPLTRLADWQRRGLSVHLPGVAARSARMRWLAKTLLFLPGLCGCGSAQQLQVPRPNTPPDPPHPKPHLNTPNAET